MKKGEKATKPYKGSIHQLVVNLRCEWCKELFEWKPHHHSRLLERLPRTCSERCQMGLWTWNWNKERGDKERGDKEDEDRGSNS